MYKMGGLIKNMPFTFVFTMIAIIAMSGVPPLTGFGGKWMLFNALMTVRKSASDGSLREARGGAAPAAA